jgi:hypothetical protein
MQIHLPTDCALLFAIPLTKQEFLLDSHENSGKEYAQLFRNQLMGFSEENVWDRYESAVAQPAHSVMEFAKMRGVFTSDRTTAEIWQTAVRNKQVVSLVAHWRSAGFSARIIEQVPNVVAEINLAQGPAGRTMSNALSAVGADVESPQTLAKLLNDSLRHAPVTQEESQGGVIWVANDPDQILDRNFEIVRAEFPHWPLQTVGMELADGVCSVTDMMGTFSSEYDGTQDLRMCHSVILGEAIKRVAPRSRVVMNQRAVRPSVQLPLYKEIVQMLETRHYDFAGAVMALHKAILKRRQG